jgi:hypothetical protein
MRHMADAASRHVRSGVLVALVLAQCFGLPGCGNVEEPVTTETTVCGKFTFRVTGRTDASRARVAFYTASVQLRGLDFSDDRFSNSSRFFLDGQKFVLQGLDNYQYTNEDAPRTLQILALHTVRNKPSHRSTPCSFQESAAGFDSMTEAISAKWPIRVELESPEYAKQRAQKR